MDAWGFLTDGFITEEDLQETQVVRTLQEIEIIVEDYIIEIEVE